jgi:hypothetical protein
MAMLIENEGVAGGGPLDERMLHHAAGNAPIVRIRDHI